MSNEHVSSRRGSGLADEAPAVSDFGSPASRVAGRLDIERYRALIEPHDLTAEQADELLVTLWSIMRTFVELGWGVESVQKVLPFMAADWTEKTQDPPNDS
jgi:hypothetical protein